MTNDRARANDETRAVKPVTDHENQSAKGFALCGDKLFEDGIAYIRQLRERQARYMESLPTDFREANSQAIRILHPDGEEFPYGIKEAFCLAFAVEAMIKDGGIDEPSPARDAALGLADMLISSMRRGTEELKRLSDILGNLDQIERDQRT
ncbi:MAG: hypothetical protein RIG84_00275 [Roseovarius sp.]